MSRPEPPPLPGLPRDELGAPVFAEPWQAKAFALTVALNEVGAIAWTDWAAALGTEIARDGDDYWRAWLRALERLLDDRAIAGTGAVEATTAAWVRAAAATPHGAPIRLGNDPLAPDRL